MENLSYTIDNSTQRDRFGELLFRIITDGINELTSEEQIEYERLAEIYLPETTVVETNSASGCVDKEQ